MADGGAFKPALLVIDFQEDFCPPNGSLAVPHGRAIAPTVNALLALPFPVRLATRDYHPADHVSFAANHSGAQPFTSSTTIAYPSDTETGTNSASHPPYETTLWPTHCVQGTPGAELVPELRRDRLQGVIDKGKRRDVEMYSAFYDPFRVSDSGLAGRLRDEGVTDVFVVGLAADFCVKATAEHAHDEGFHSYIIDEGTRPVLPDKWAECRDEITARGVKIVSVDGDEVARVKALP
ncbi:pyrazinamidase/nicotinamidase [Purpureocillium lilacinum]|nr:pyrazinamidase/nicotinamidase [Purpureocillium lilacinum]OAQ76607.1 pyrazinamidase/nicotinamidase [Purpureocillium lilacinum]OAQ78150.1 pyrazinamidase/nicotinamidase [Purpureocillium lilacinum]GJN75847.1 NAD(+) salvage pathway protein [Purpureocillium lilacinum]